MFVTLDYGVDICVYAVTGLNVSDTGVTVFGTIDDAPVQGYSVHPDFHDKVLNMLGVSKCVDDSLHYNSAPVVSLAVVMDRLTGLLSDWQGCYIDFKDKHEAGEQPSFTDLDDLAADTEDMLRLIEAGD